MVPESQNMAVTPDSILSLKLSVKMCLYLNVFSDGILYVQHIADCSTQCVQNDIAMLVGNQVLTIV